MSLVLRTLLRDPLLARPLSRALRRFDNDFWLDELPVKRVRRVVAPLESSTFIEDMNRQMAATMNKMQEFAEDLDSLLYDRPGSTNDENLEPRRRERPQSVVKRTETGGLQLALDVADYKPEDIKIKLVDDNLVIEAVSETSGENSYQRSQFKKWFKLPEDCKLDAIKSKVTDDNRLLIELPSSRPEAEKRARSIPIEMAKPPESNNQEQHSQATGGTESTHQGQ